jgi:hypothetical protein
MALEDVIAGAIADAREDGLEGAQMGDEPSESADEAVVDDGTVDGDAPADEGAKDDDAPTDEPVVVKDEPTDEEAPAAKAEKKEDEPVEGDDLMKELGLKERADGRVQRIPLPRVEKIIANARNKATESVKAVVTSVGKALGLADEDLATATPETLAPRLTEALSEMTTLRQQTAIMDSLSPIMINDGDAFVKMLAASNPQQYGKFLAVLEDGFTPPTAAATALVDEKNDPMPTPDLPVTLGDGTKGHTYSQAQHEKLLAWQERKSERKFNAALEKRFKPLDDQQKAAQTVQAQQQQMVTALNEFMDEAHQWKGFEASKDAILAATKLIDKKVPFRRAVRQAYEEVVFGKLHSDRSTLRAEILAELKAAPGATSGTRKGAVVAKKDDDVPVRGEGGEVVSGAEAAIRRSLAKARATGALR